MSESDFGCWLSSLRLPVLPLHLRRNDNRTCLEDQKEIYAVLGGLFFFGAITTFVISFMQRQRLTNGRPSNCWKSGKRRRKAGHPIRYCTSAGVWSS